MQTSFQKVRHWLSDSSCLISGKFVLLFQVCDQYSRTFSSRGLYDSLLSWGHAQKADAKFWLAEKMLSDD